MNKETQPVLDEISAVLKKHNMIGIVIAANPTHVDFTMQVEASWSCAAVEMIDGRRALRIRAMRKDYPSKEARHAALETTVGTFVTFGDVLKHISEGVDQTLIMLARHVDFDGKSIMEE